MYAMLESIKTYPPIKILFAVWELEPFLKVGGLGELARSLPRALHEINVDIRVVIPKYSSIKYHNMKRIKVGTIMVPYGKKMVKVAVYKSSFLKKNIPVYFLEQKKFFSTVVPETFTLFPAAIMEGLHQDIFSWQPDIIHCNDYHAGLIPLLVKTKKLSYKTLLTIHSVKNQGRRPKEHAFKLGISEENLSLMQWEIQAKKFNLLLEAIVNADIVNTVSPTYAQEIMYEPEGYDLEGALRNRCMAGSYYAIINGIDYDLKNPQTSPGVLHPYTLATVMEGKQKNKAAFQRKMGLTQDVSIPLVGFIGRLDNSQKGIDRLHRMLWRLGNKSFGFVVMGTGEKAWEERFMTLAAFHAKSIVFFSKYIESLAAYINAASDFILVPSNYEPCGQVQLNAMRYGALPIVRATGGLSDTVRNEHNGFVYTGNSSFDLEHTLKHAINIKNAFPDKFRKMTVNAMKTDNSWNASAEAYKQLYMQLMMQKSTGIDNFRVAIVKERNQLHR